MKPWNKVFDDGDEYPSALSCNGVVPYKSSDNSEWTMGFITTAHPWEVSCGALVNGEPDP